MLHKTSIGKTIVIVIVSKHQHVDKRYDNNDGGDT